MATTPTPWRASEPQEIGNIIYTADKPKRVIAWASLCNANRQNDLALIVRAVNAHDVLTSTCEVALGYLEMHGLAPEMQGMLRRALAAARGDGHDE